MSDPRFLVPTTTLTLAEVIALTQASASVSDDARVFRDVAALDRAGSGVIAFADPGDGRLARTRAGACLVAPDDVALLPVTTIALVVPAPAPAFARIVAAFYPGAERPMSMVWARGVNPAAFIHPEARLEPGVTIDPGVVVGPKAEIGSGTVVGANSVIGPNVRIGRDCAIGAHVTIDHALIGNAVIIAPGVRIGQNSYAGHPFPGLGRVIIQDRVAIGANTTVDRGGLADTVVGDGSRIGNLVHVERDRVIARHSVV